MVCLWDDVGDGGGGLAMLSHHYGRCTSVAGGLFLYLKIHLPTYAKMSFPPTLIQSNFNSSNFNIILKLNQLDS